MDDSGQDQEVYLQQPSWEERDPGLAEIVEQFIKAQRATANINGDGTNIDTINPDTSSYDVLNHTSSHYNHASSIDDIGDRFRVSALLTD